MPDSQKWAFDESVTACFDDMLARSIPHYDVMRKACFDLGRRYAQPKTDIVDLGASRGEALAPFIREFGIQNRFVAVEISEPMRAAMHERFAGLEDAGAVRILDTDLRRSFPRVNASVILSVLTLQFTPIEYRQKIVESVYDGLMPGGAFIFVEKILGADAKLNDQMVETYYDLKRANGYSDESIERKRLSLEGVLVPVTARWNEELLRGAGFRRVDCFWRWFNFAGWIAVKSK